jgi:hypothetical protein
MKTVTADQLRVGDVLFPGRERVSNITAQRGGLEVRFGTKTYWLPSNWKLVVIDKEGC